MIRAGGMRTVKNWQRRTKGQGNQVWEAERRGWLRRAIMASVGRVDGVVAQVRPGGGGGKQGERRDKARADRSKIDVVSQDIVRLAFLLAAANDLKIFAGDIGYAYLNAPTQEKIFLQNRMRMGSCN